MPEPVPAAKPRQQVAALPIRLRDGVTEVLLITSRETGRWIIPKGWLKKGMAPHAAAAREAFEEAGLIGTASKLPVGIYRYVKRLSAAESVPCEVRVFVIDVERQTEDWPERTQRQQRWLAPEAAAHLVAEAGLAVMLHRLAAVAHKPGKLLAALRAGMKAERSKTSQGRRKGAARRESGSRATKRGRNAAEPDRERRDRSQQG